MGKEAARLQAEIEALLTKAGMVDAEEDERWGEDFRGDELPEELQRREKRLAAIQAAKARLEAAQRGRDAERGREPGQDRNPRGGRPYKRRRARSSSFRPMDWLSRMGFSEVDEPDYALAQDPDRAEYPSPINANLFRSGLPVWDFHPLVGPAR